MTEAEIAALIASRQAAASNSIAFLMEKLEEATERLTNGINSSIELPPGGGTNTNYVATAVIAKFYRVARTGVTGFVDGWGVGLGTVFEGLTNAFAISAGPWDSGAHSLAVRSDGSVAAWGNNFYGQCNVPTNLTDVVAVAAGGRHSVALRRDGSITNWGDNKLGQITNPPPNLTNVVDVKAGLWHTMALKRDGAVAVWGNLFIRTNNQPAGLTNVTAISAGPQHCLALKCDGTVVAWGFSHTSVLPNTFLPTNVPASLSNVIAISAGMEHNEALLQNGNVVVWGNTNNSGVRDVPLLTNMVGMSSGWHYGLALTNSTNGILLTWGQTDNNANRDSVVALSAGGNHVVLIRTNFDSPVIFTNPHAVFAPTNTATNLSVSAGSALPLSYQWEKHNGTSWAVLSGKTSTTLSFPSLQDSDDGLYRVLVSTTNRSIHSRTALVETIHAPVISNPQPELDLFRPPYTDTHLTVDIYSKGGPIPRYEWFHNGQPTGVPAFGAYPLNFRSAAEEGDYFLVVSNAAGVATSAVWHVSVTLRGEAKMWGDSTIEQRNGLSRNVTNLVSISAGGFHTLGLREDGTVIAWGRNDVAQTNVPAGLSNVIAVAAGGGHSLALLENGTVRAWGQNFCGQTNVPGGLTNVTAIAAGGSQSLALQHNGSIIVWGCSPIPTNVTGAMAMSAYADHGIVLYSNGTVQVWNSGSIDLTPPAGLSNVVEVASGFDHLLALRKNGTVTAWGANDYGQTNVPAGLSNVMKIAAGGQFSIAMLNDRSVVSWGRNDYGQTNVLSGIGEVHDIAAGLLHSVAIAENPGLQYPINVPNDLLLICNTNPESVFVKDYYLKHRPMVWNANVMMIATAPRESIAPSDFTNHIRTPVLNWLAENPTKRPRYWILFLGVPSRIDSFTEEFEYVPSSFHSNSVSYDLSFLIEARSPLITHINMGNTNHIGDTNACRAYIDKLSNFGTNYSPGKVVISASAGGYGNSHYIFDEFPGNFQLGGAELGVLAAGVAATNILRQVALPNTDTGTNLAGYLSRGIHGWQGTHSTINGEVVFTGNSSWYIMMTVESFNGMRFWENHGHGTFIDWFSDSAFGGTDFANTPVGAVSHTEEPTTDGASNAAIYFGYWASGKLFCVAAWASKQTSRFQAVGDPFVRR